MRLMDQHLKNSHLSLLPVMSVSSRDWEPLTKGNEDYSSSLIVVSKGQDTWVSRTYLNMTAAVWEETSLSLTEKYKGKYSAQKSH